MAIHVIYCYIWSLPICFVFFLLFRFNVYGVDLTEYQGSFKYSELVRFYGNM
jgi:hypothetical protein